MNIDNVTNFKSLIPPFNIEISGGVVDIVTNDFGFRKKVVNFRLDKENYLKKIFDHWWNLKEEHNLYVTVIQDFPAPLSIDDGDRNFTKRLVVKPYEGELDYILKL